MRNIIIFHSDPDGYMAAALMYRQLQDMHHPDEVEVEMIPWSYEKPWPDMDGANVICLDLCLAGAGGVPATTADSIRKTSSFLIIDHHHATPKEEEWGDILSLDEDELQRSFKIVRRIGTAACELTHEFVRRARGESAFPVPRAVQLIADWDVHDPDMTIESVHLYSWFSSQELSIDMMLGLLDDEGYLRIAVREGAVIERHMNYLCRSIIDHNSIRIMHREMHIATVVLCCHGSMIAPITEELLRDRTQPDVAVAVVVSPPGERTKVSLRSRKNTVNVAVAAGRLNGGGHYSAAGGYINSHNLEWIKDRITQALVGDTKSSDEDR